MLSNAMKFMHFVTLEWYMGIFGGLWAKVLSYTCVLAVQLIMQVEFTLLFWLKATVDTFLIYKTSRQQS